MRTLAVAVVNSPLINSATKANENASLAIVTAAFLYCRLLLGRMNFLEFANLLFPTGSGLQCSPPAARSLPTSLPPASSHTASQSLMASVRRHLSKAHLGLKAETLTDLSQCRLSQITWLDATVISNCPNFA